MRSSLYVKDKEAVKNNIDLNITYDECFSISVGAGELISMIRVGRLEGDNAKTWQVNGIIASIEINTTFGRGWTVKTPLMEDNGRDGSTFSVAKYYMTGANQFVDP